GRADSERGAEQGPGRGARPPASCRPRTRRAALARGPRARHGGGESRLAAQRRLLRLPDPLRPEGKREKSAARGSHHGANVNFSASEPEHTKRPPCRDRKGASFRFCSDRRDFESRAVQIMALGLTATTTGPFVPVTNRRLA